MRGIPRVCKCVVNQRFQEYGMTEWKTNPSISRRRQFMHVKSKWPEEVPVVSSGWRQQTIIVGRWLAFFVVVVGQVTASGKDKTSVDWPGWRGPQRTGIAMESGWKPSWPDAPKILWRASVGKGFSSLAVSKDRVFTIGNQEDVDSVFCLDAESGEVLWRHSYPCPLTPLSYEGGPSFFNYLEYNVFYTLSKWGHLFCLDAGTGKVLWSKKSAPAPRNEGDYQVDWGYSASPLVLDEKLILSVGWAGMALNKVDGTPIWDNGPGRPGYSSPVPFTQSERQYLAMLVARGVVAVEAEGGKIVWTIPWRTNWDQNAPDVVVADGKLFVSTGHGVGCGLFDITSGVPAELWRNKNMRNELSSSVLWNGCLYGFDNNQLACIDWQTGESQWSARGLGRGAIVLINGYLVVVGDKGQFIVAPATSESYRPLGDPWAVLSGRCWTAPAFSGGRVLVRSSEGEVVCLDMRQ